MTKLYLAANYVLNNNNVGYGHLQIVYGANELEVQSGVFGPLGRWVVKPIRNHLDPDHTPYADGSHPDQYGVIEVDTSIPGSDRTAEDVWSILTQAHVQFAAQANIPYDFNKNSNSYATTLLGIVGISSSGYAAQLANNIQSIDSFPGVQRWDILQEYSINFSLVGGDHDDIIFTGIGEDNLSGGAGNDEFWSRAGIDQLYGGAGDDELHAGADDDTLVGDRGNDILYGEEGSDTADYSGTLVNADSSGTNGISVDFSVGGNSSLVASVVDNWGGSDTLIDIENIIGTDMTDSFSVSGNAVTIFANVAFFDGRGSGDGEGDTINFSGITGSNGIFVDLSLAGGFASLTAGFNFGDTIGVPNFENVVGSDSNDTITGNASNNILYGGEGADRLSGGAGDDIIIFDADDTLVDGGAGRDVGIVTGEAGVTVDLAATGLEVVVGGAGADNFTLQTPAGVNSPLCIETLLSLSRSGVLQDTGSGRCTPLAPCGATT